jgi:protein ImuB
MKRVMCVYLPEWSIQQLCHEQPELRGKPFILVDSQAARGPLVVRCSSAASRLGIRPGMPVAEATAVHRELLIHEVDPEKDVQALGQLAQWLERYSPFVGLEDCPDPQSLLLDISGCAPFFRGEDRLLQRAMRELKEQGWWPRIAVADTIGAAWALAHHGNTPCLAAPGEAEKLLLPLSVAALRLPAEILDLLGKLGMRWIHQLIALPRSSIPARFGAIVLRRLDQAFGRTPEVLVPHRVLPEVEVGFVFEFPTNRLEVLFRILEQLIGRIQETLQKRNQGARQLECWLYHEAAPPFRIEVLLSRPSRSPHHLGTLLRTHLERVRLAEPVGAVCLRVGAAEPLDDRQAEIFAAESQYQDFRNLPDFGSLIDCLSSRLGREAVTRATLVPDLQPECACHFEPAIEREVSDRGRRKVAADWSSPSVDAQTLFPRPLRLRSQPVSLQVVALTPDGPPIRFRWEGVDYRVLRSWGPERIETGWWRGNDVHRDYYVAATHLGNRFWIFRRQDDGRWFLHGCFD